jgi:hypothetical protein
MGTANQSWPISAGGSQPLPCSLAADVNGWSKGVAFREPITAPEPLAHFKMQVLLACFKMTGFVGFVGLRM